MTHTIPIKDGCVDIVYSPDDGGFYLHRYIFSEKRDFVSKRIWPTEREAIAALAKGRIRWVP